MDAAVIPAARGLVRLHLGLNQQKLERLLTSTAVPTLLTGSRTGALFGLTEDSSRDGYSRLRLTMGALPRASDREDVAES
jgi:hypothetical protein